MNLKHFGLGNVASAVGLSKGTLKDALALGAGATAAITGSELLQSKVLVSNGTPMIPVTYAPWFTAAVSVIGGGLAKHKFHLPNFGDGMIAGGVGIAVSALISSFTSPAVAASTAAATAAEATSAPAQQVAGFGFGRVYSSGLRGLAGLGRVPQPRALFGQRNGNMAGARMFNGATVAIEQPGQMSGATVAIEPQNRFASALS